MERSKMEQMRVYIANLGKYVEGELVGSWFIPPIDFDEVKKQIGLNKYYEEYAIHDYELPFEIDEYTSVDEINRMCELVEGLPDYIRMELKNLLGFFVDLDDLNEHMEDIIYYPECEDMEDVAREYIEESGNLDVIPDFLHPYIDYEALGRDIEIEGNFIITYSGVYQFIG